MIKSLRTVQQWDNWLTQPLGKQLLDAERQFLPTLLMDCYGKHALLIGVPSQYSLLKFNSLSHHVLLGPLINKNKYIKYVEGEYRDLPIASATVDFVLLPHTLEYIDNPQQLLREACRIVKPEGYLIILGFNPYSLWGLKKKIMKDSGNNIPWSSNFIPAGMVKKWLNLAEFELIKQTTLIFRPPLQHHATIYSKLKILEWLGSKLWAPFGGVYILMAKAKVIPLTPIKVHWKQQLSGVQVSIPGPSVRNW